MDATNPKFKPDTSRAIPKNAEESFIDNRTRPLRSNTRRIQEKQNITLEEKLASTSSTAIHNDIADDDIPRQWRRTTLQRKKSNINSDVVNLLPNVDQDNYSGSEGVPPTTCDAQPAEDLKNIFDRNVPAYNVPEKIVIAVDIAQDELFSNFQLSNGNSCKPLSMLKRAIRMFLYNKQSIDTTHEYALVVLNENTSSWVLDFTSDVKQFLVELDEIVECSAEDIFNLNSLFDVIAEHVAIPFEGQEISTPPPYIIRVILFYGRSYTLPEIDRNEAAMILNSPYFTLDVLMTHEPPSTNNHCVKILKTLQRLDTKGLSYFFAVARNPNLLLTSTAKLLPHPLQRPIQTQANYSYCM